VSTTSIVEISLAEEAVAGKTLGRHLQQDPRSKRFPAPQAAAIVSVRHGMDGMPLNQEAHSCCTAHALCGVLAADRVTRRQAAISAIPIYEQAKRLEDPGGSLVDEAGSSGLMACKAAKSMGLIASYHHAFGIEQALRALVLGPVMTGFKWYSSFDHPDPQTALVELTPAATVRGGHEVVADEIDVESELVWFYNSWGPDFGLEGRFCMKFDTWALLLEDQGDVTVPVP
jgi:hypothetical protein